MSSPQKTKLDYVKLKVLAKQHYYKDISKDLQLQQKLPLDRLESNQEYCLSYQKFCDIKPRSHIDDHTFVKGTTENTLFMCNYNKNGLYCNRFIDFHTKIPKKILTEYSNYAK